MAEPVEVVAEELRVQREVGAPRMSERTYGAGAWLILNALHEDGWRIVRLRDGVEFDPTNPAIVDEWTPTGDRPASPGVAQPHKEPR